jgi:pimeloyl-ACP methyl ester carboxylesterase
VVHRASSRRLRIVGAAVIVLAILALEGCGEQSVNLCGVDVAGKLIHYRTADGVQLTGAAAGRGDRGVVFANGWNSANRGRMVPVSQPIGLTTSGIYCTWLSDPRLAHQLLRSGFQLLMFDYRGTGKSGAGRGAAAHRYDLDVDAAVDEARRRHVRDFILVGGSFGGVVVVATARELRPRPAAIVTLSASGFDGTNSGRDYGNLDAKAAVEQLDVPLLLIASMREGAGFVDSRALAAAGKMKSKELDLVPGSAHSTELLGNAGVRQSIVDFIEQHVNR